MTLTVHPVSQCDVCYSKYAGEIPGKIPHAIACGHIFCRDCLYSVTPPECPECRRMYQPNKMKKLYVAFPKDCDDQQEVDLLQRLAMSWDIQPDQLGEVIDEVDSWLARRADGAALPLRKARKAVLRIGELKGTELRLLDIVHDLRRQIDQWASSMAHESTNWRQERKALLAHNDSMALEIKDLRSQVESLQTRTWYNVNPLPEPPRPVPTPNLTSYVHALAEYTPAGHTTFLEGSIDADVAIPKRKHKQKSYSVNSYDNDMHYDTRFQQGSSRQTGPPRRPTPAHNLLTRVHEYALLETSPGHTRTESLSDFEVEGPKRKAKGKASFNERRSNTYDDSRLQQGSSRHTGLSQRSSPSHYVEAHIHSHEPSPAVRSIRLLDHHDATDPSLNIYSIAHAYVENYSAGYQNGQTAAARMRQENPRAAPTDRNHRYLLPPASAHNPVQENPPITTVYPNYPHSAPITHERSPRRRHTTHSSIVYSSPTPSPAHEDSSGWGSSSSGQESTIPADDEVNNLPLGSILLGPDASPEPEPAFIRPPSRRPSPSSPPSAPAEPAPAPAPAPAPRTGTRSEHSARTFDSWGTDAASHLTEGSLIQGLFSLRPGVALEPFEVGHIPLRNSDADSVRTREMSVSSAGGYDDLFPGSRSPPRPIESMVGVIPGLTRDGLQAHSDGQVSRHSNDWDEHPTRGTHSSGYGSTSTTRGALHNSNPANQSTLPADDGYQRISWDDSWQSWSNNTHVNEHNSNGQPRFAADVRSPGQSESGRRHNATRSSSDNNVHRDHRRPRPAVQSLPESPADIPWNHAFSDHYAVHQSGHAVIGHATPDAAPPSSFPGNALGLEMAAGAQVSINAPTPVMPPTFLRSWSQDR